MDLHEQRATALNEQATRAVDDLFAAQAVTGVSDARNAAALVWFDGYKAGMDTVKRMADASFAEIERAL